MGKDHIHFHLTGRPMVCLSNVGKTKNERACDQFLQVVVFKYHIKNPCLFKLGMNIGTSFSYIMEHAQETELTKILLKQVLQRGGPYCSLLVVSKLYSFQSDIVAKQPNISTLSEIITAMSVWYLVTKGYQAGSNCIALSSILFPITNALIRKLKCLTYRLRDILCF